jgi:cysteine desulfurase
MIYFDNNSTTRVNDEVLASMLPYFTEHYGNYSSSNHSFGWIAKSAVEYARASISKLINSRVNEIIFTSGATESINTAIHSIINIYGEKRRKVLVVSTEHKAVLDVLASYWNKGLIDLIYIDVDREGLLDMTLLDSQLDETVLMVCVMLANNETGVINPITAISCMAKQRGVIVFCDATQAIGKLPVDVDELNVDLMCFSAHKFYGPKGVGALYIRNRNPRIVFKSFINGGGQEQSRRSGTLNVPGIVGMGRAAEIVIRDLWENMSYLSQLRNHFEHQLLDYDITINGSTRYRLCNTSNICFNNLKAQNIFNHLKDVAISPGSACASSSIEPSHVLKSMGLSREDIDSSIRFSFGIFNTISEVDTVLNKLKPILEFVK